MCLDSPLRGECIFALGQPLSTFSGGERQRVKLAQNIKKNGNIYILDEPTTGLHAADIEKVVILLILVLMAEQRYIYFCDTVTVTFL